MARQEFTLVDYHINCSSELLAKQDRKKQEKSITFYKLSVADVIVANKRLTDKELDEIIKFSIDPSTVLKDNKDAERLADIGTKSVRVGDVVNMINQIVSFHEESLDRELGLLEYIIENKLGLKKREIKKFAKEYQSRIDTKIADAKEKVKESDNNR